MSRIAPVVGGVLTVALAATGVATRTTAAPPPPVVATTRPLTEVQLVCPGLDGSTGAPAQISAVDASALLGTAPSAPPRVTRTALLDAADPGDADPPAPTTWRVAPAATVTSSDRLPATVVAASGPGAAALAAVQHTLVPGGALRGLVSAPCLPATADTWITGADGRVGHTDVLVLANPGAVDANLTVSAWSATGRVEPPRLQSYSLPAGRSVALDVATYAPDAGLLTFHVHANVGRVVAQIRDNQALGLATTGTDWLPPTLPPATHVVVPGFPAGAGPRLVVITNPGRSDATVHPRVIAGDRAFVPAGHPDLTVPPQRSVLLDLTSSLGEAAAAVELTSDQPVVAAGMSRVTQSGGLPDLQWQPAGAPLVTPGLIADNTVPFGHDASLFLTAVGGGGRVRLVTASGRTRAVSVPADRTSTIDLPAQLGSDYRGPIAIVPVSGAVWASRTLLAAGTHGPLLTALAPARVPPPLRFPVVAEDPRAAVR